MAFFGWFFIQQFWISARPILADIFRNFKWCEENTHTHQKQSMKNDASDGLQFESTCFEVNKKKFTWANDTWWKLWRQKKINMVQYCSWMYLCVCVCVCVWRRNDDYWRWSNNKTKKKKKIRYEWEHTKMVFLICFCFEIHFIWKTRRGAKIQYIIWFHRYYKSSWSRRIHQIKIEEDWRGRRRKKLRTFNTGNIITVHHDFVLIKFLWFVRFFLLYVRSLFLIYKKKGDFCYRVFENVHERRQKGIHHHERQLRVQVQIFSFFSNCHIKTARFSFS